MAAVAAGGVVGVAARMAVATVFDGGGVFPWATLLVNLVGSLCLGLVVGRLARRRTRSPLVEAFLATGVLASFTTYSAFAVETNRLLGDQPLLAVAYVALSVAGGVAAARAGLSLGRR